ncbi:ABC transporter [Caldinitratiruptor microaerophilus]|uniref:ABC transporter n=1 Tax=Caldinitratiruptor microaerophilus TaxID=671077 RepID=A0AA35CNP7_9FIRM|nr:ABC transporter [Caldinitratiruptor microaerophilus]
MGTVSERTRSVLVAVVLVAIYVALTTLRQAGAIDEYWSQVMDLSLIITISAVGLSLIYGFTGQFSLGHAAFYGIGAYVAGYVTKTLGGSLPLYVLALAAGAAFAAAVAFLIGLPILRLRSDYLGIATLGFGIIVKVVMDNTDKFLPAMGGPRGMLGIPQVTTFGWIYWAAVATIVLARNLVHSSPGRAAIAVREDEIAADIMGIDTTRYKTLMFVLGAGLAGLAGGLYAHRYPFLHPTSFDFLKSLDVLLIVVLGGLGSLTGTVVTAIGWVFLLEWLRNVLPQDFLDWRGVIYALVLIVLMILRPQGLLGGRELVLVPRREPAKGGSSHAAA